MARALVLLATGFEEIEAVTIVDTLRRADVAVTVAALEPGPVRGAHDIVIAPDATIAEVMTSDFDAVVLPGGAANAKNLAADQRVLELVRRFAQQGKLTAAICAAPTVLQAAGVLEGVRATSYPGFQLPSAQYVEERVVESGPIVTSRGPGTAMDFAFTLVERLAGREAKEELRRRMLAA